MAKLYTKSLQPERFIERKRGLDTAWPETVTARRSPNTAKPDRDHLHSHSAADLDRAGAVLRSVPFAKPDR